MTKQTSKKASVKRQENSENSQSSLRQVPSEEPEIVAQDGLATEHLIEHSPPETKRPRTGEDSESRESPIIVTDPAPPVEDRPLSPNSKQEIVDELAKLAAKIDKTEEELEKLNLEKEKCEKALANASDKDSLEYHRKERLLVLQEKASLQEEKTSLQNKEVILQARLAAREKSSDLPVLPESVSTYCLPLVSAEEQAVKRQRTVLPDSHDKMAVADSGSVVTGGRPESPKSELVQIATEWTNSFSIPSAISSKLFTHKEDDPIHLFRRSAVDDLERSLFPDNDAPGSLHCVNGPPGTGKSTSTFALLCTHADPDNDMLWIECIGQSIAYISEGSIRTDRPEDGSRNEWIFAYFKARARLQIVCLDQFIKESCQALFHFFIDNLGSGKIKKLIILSSDGSCDLRSLTPVEVKDFNMPPWTMEEYTAAIDSDVEIRKRFLKTFSNEDSSSLKDFGEKLNLKYHFAGISCRYMFDNTVEQIVADVGRAIRRVSNLGALQNGQIGAGSKDAVNRLFYAAKSTPLNLFSSNYVASYLGANERSGSLIKQFKAYCDHDGYNAAVGGCYFEAFVVSKLKEPKFKIPELGDLSGSVVVDFNDSIPQIGKWLRPTKSNQAGFDLVRVDCSDSKVTITFVQVTIKTNREVNEDHFVATARILIELSGKKADPNFVCEVSITFFIPKAITTQFKWTWKDPQSEAAEKQKSRTDLVGASKAKKPANGPKTKKVQQRLFVPENLGQIDARYISPESTSNQWLGLVRKIGFPGSNIFKDG